MCGGIKLNIMMKNNELMTFSKILTKQIATKG